MVPLDLAVVVDSGGGDLVLGPCDDQLNPCAAGLRCFQSACILDDGTCSVDDDCEDDSWCDCTTGGGDGGPCVGGVCVPWGTKPRGSFDPGCVGQTTAPLTAPVTFCHWPANNEVTSGTLSTPLVIDLDGDKKPEIVFLSYPDRFVALHGADCSVYFDKKVQFSESNQSQLAAADLDGDGVPEIVGVDAKHRVVVFDHMGNLLATSPTPYLLNFPGNKTTGIDWSGPAIADVDNQAPPEIAVAGQVVRYVKGSPNLTVLFTVPVDATEFGSLTVLADLDGDHRPELIAGKQILDGVTGADKTPTALKNLDGVGAFPAVADFNGDKKPDLVLIQSVRGQGRASIFDFANNTFLFGPYSIPNGGGAPPTVADFDGDGLPEFSSSGTDGFYVFKPACAKMNRPASCEANSNIGVLWSKTIQDHSASTGATVFDLNGDGVPEVIYRDECWLRIYRGTDGKTLFATYLTSATGVEYPVVADVDNDGHANLVVTSDAFVSGVCPQKPEAETMSPSAGSTTGIVVYQDMANLWRPSRPLWNQHSYHVTNINDDGTIPTIEQDSWLGLNDYRQSSTLASSQKPLMLIDLTAGFVAAKDDPQPDCVNVWTLRAEICNRGTATAMPPLSGTFYPNDPRVQGVPPICTAVTQKAIAPGDCAIVACPWTGPPQTAADVWFRAGDTGMSAPPLSECKSKNNLLYRQLASCM